MCTVKNALFCFLVTAMMLCTSALSVRSAEEYAVTLDQVEKEKAFFDDPRPIFKNLSF